MHPVLITCRTVTFAVFVSIILSTGCVGPMWHKGSCGVAACGSNACGTGSCGDGCGSCQGCGELYIDPWINEPADCGDPCDSCGNYNGQSCGKCRGIFAGVKSLWGYQCDDGHGAGGCDGGCDSGGCGCGASHGSAYESSMPMMNEYEDGEIIYEGESIIQGGVTGSGTRSRANARTQVAHRPAGYRSTGERQIFQPRRVNGPKKPLAY